MEKKSSIPGLIVIILLGIAVWVDRYYPIPYGDDPIAEIPVKPGVVYATSVHDTPVVPVDTLTQTVTSPSTNIPTSTVTPTITVTETPTPTSVPPIRWSMNHRTAHDTCGTWTDVFIVVDGEDLLVPQWIECWPRESRADERLLVWDEGMIFDLNFEKPEFGFSESYINAILPFGFEAALYEIVVYCDDLCEVEAFYDESSFPFWTQEVQIEQGVVSFILESSYDIDGYILISHADVRGGSSVYVGMHKVDQ
jgi:hypothetical protein